jgi:hypothetical protein
LAFNIQSLELASAELDDENAKQSSHSHSLLFLFFLLFLDHTRRLEQHVCVFVIGGKSDERGLPAEILLFYITTT